MSDDNRHENALRSFLRRHPRAQILIIAAVFYGILFGTLVVVAAGIALKFSAE